MAGLSTEKPLKSGPKPYFAFDGAASEPGQAHQCPAQQKPLADGAAAAGDDPLPAQAADAPQRRRLPASPASVALRLEKNEACMRVFHEFARDLTCAEHWGARFA